MTVTKVSHLKQFSLVNINKKFLENNSPTSLSIKFNLDFLVYNGWNC